MTSELLKSLRSTDSANAGWLRRLVRCHGHTIKLSPSKSAIRILGKHKVPHLYLSFLDLYQSTSQPRQRCNDKSGGLACAPPQSDLPADTASNMKTPLHKLQINYSPKAAIYLQLSALGLIFLLSRLPDNSQQILIIALAVQAGCLLGGCSIIFGGSLSCDDKRTTPNDES